MAKIVIVNTEIGYYVLIVSVSLLFFLLNKIKIKNIILFFKSVFANKIFVKDKNPYKNNIILEEQKIDDVVENRTQVDLPFNKKLDRNKTSYYILPKVNILSKAQHGEKKIL